MLCSLVAKHSRSSRVGRIPGVVAKWDQEHTKLILCACVIFNLLNITGVCHSHCNVSVAKFISKVGAVSSNPVLSEISCIGKLFELVQNLKHFLIVSKCSLICIQSIVKSWCSFFVDTTDLEECQLMLPAICTWHKPWGNSLFCDLSAKVFQLCISRWYLPTILFEQCFVINHYIFW